MQLPLPPRPDVLPPARTSGFAVASLVLGIAGFNPLFFAIPSILAIWFGFSARHKISRSSGLVRGKGIATAGTALGVLSLIGFVVFAWMTTTQLKQCNGDLFCGM